MKQELLDDLQRLLKCPKPKKEYAGEGALSGWNNEAHDLGREIKNEGDPTDRKWLERPISVKLLGMGVLNIRNFGQYARQYYEAAVMFRRFVFTLVYYHAQTNPSETDRKAYELALREMEMIWVSHKERSGND